MPRPSPPPSQSGQLAARGADRSTAGWRLDPVVVGTFYWILSAVAYTGASMALRHVARPHDLDWAVWVSCLKAVPASLVAWGLIGWRAWRGLPALPPARLVLPLVLTGLFMQFGGNVMFQWALGLGGLALTVPLNFAALILSGAWLGRLVLGESLSPRSAVAMGLLVASIVVLSGGAEGAAGSLVSDPTPLVVFGAVVGACLAGVAYGASGVVIRRVVTQQVSLSATLVWLSTTGVLGLGLVSLIRLGPQPLLATAPGDLAVMLTAGVLNAVAFFSVGEALRQIPVNRVNMLNASQAALAGAAGVIWFAEPLTGWLTLGMLLTIIGLLMMNGRSK